jgi:hypothetical protein
MRLFNSITLLLAAGAMTLFAACGDDPKPATDTSTTDTVTSDTGGDTSADTNVETDTNVTSDYATLVFTIDDSANGTYDATDGLAWKGSFAYDAATNIVAFDNSWGGPFPMLYDDGTHGDATAGDHIWTCGILFATPEADQEFGYGAISGSVDGSDGQWIWQGTNGSVTITAGETGTVTATGLVIPAFGTTDLKLTIDVSDSGANLGGAFDLGTGSYTTVKVKGGAWGWVEVEMTDDATKGDDTAGDEIYTFVLSENLTKHTGLLVSGAEAPFVFVLDGVEYKVDGAPPTDGVNAFLNTGAGFQPAAIQNYPDGDKNTYVKVAAAAFVPPADTVAVNFKVDDSANQTYEASDAMAWKGSFNYDETTRVLAFDNSWGGPYVPLYDDGAWDAGGHEPAGSVAGDHIWGVTVWVSNAAEQEFGYGLVRNYVAPAAGDWIWVGGNGAFTVTAGATTAIDAQGLTIGAFGEIDMRLTIDAANVSSLFAGSTSFKVKGSAWAWGEVTMTDDGTKGDVTAADGIWTFVLSENTGKHDGLLSSGQQPQFVFVLDAVEYKADGAADATGVAAYVKPAAGDWASVTVESQTDGDKNTFITAP